MTGLHARCPLAGTDGAVIDLTVQGAGDLRWRAKVCPLTGLALTATQATTGQVAGIPVTHDRWECPQPCMTQWWRDSTDDALSWQGSELMVDYPDLDDDEPGGSPDGPLLGWGAALADPET